MPLTVPPGRKALPGSFRIAVRAASVDPIRRTGEREAGAVFLLLRRAPKASFALEFLNEPGVPRSRRFRAPSNRPS